MFETAFRQPLTSWDNIARPVLFGTGAGDVTCSGSIADCNGDTPYRRRIPFERIPAPDKYLMYIDHTETYHGLFGSLGGGCAAQGVAPADCANFVSWLSSSVLAFLDAHVRGIPAAYNWLQLGLMNRPAETSSSGG